MEDSLIKSLICAIASILFCVYEQHFQIVWSDPLTYTAPFSHKCGWAMVLCILWALGEVVLYVTAAFSERSAEKVRASRKRFKPAFVVTHALAQSRPRTNHHAAPRLRSYPSIARNAASLASHS